MRAKSYRDMSCPTKQYVIKMAFFPTDIYKQYNCKDLAYMESAFGTVVELEQELD